MKINKKIKVTAYSILGLAFIFIVTMVVHIAVMVKNKAPIENATIQMARVDFPNSLNRDEYLKIEKNVKMQDGVKDVFYNEKNFLLIYTFDNRKNTTENIYKKSIENPEISSHIFAFSEEDAAKGCPVINPNSFYGQLTKLVTKIIN